MHPVLGIHHITAVASDPIENWRFYTRVMGERLVKKTVNFDDPGTYHLYYGDRRGSPGTILTFFPWRKIPRKPAGNRQVTALAYAVAESSLDYWAKRLGAHGVTATPFTRFGESGLAFVDPDGMALELIGVPAPPDVPAWEQSPVPPAHRLRGFHSATATVPESARSLELLTGALGFAEVDRAGARSRLRPGGDASAPGTWYDLVVDPDLPDHGLGAGIVHHIAFRAADPDHQTDLRNRVREFGLQPTDPVDRNYFLSIYFREPSGILYEIATDPPGFSRDEDPDALGTALKLPGQHEHLRKELEHLLPALPPP